MYQYYYILLITSKLIYANEIRNNYYITIIITIILSYISIISILKPSLIVYLIENAAIFIIFIIT